MRPYSCALHIPSFTCLLVPIVSPEPDILRLERRCHTFVPFRIVEVTTRLALKCKCFPSRRMRGFMRRGCWPSDGIITRQQEQQREYLVNVVYLHYQPRLIRHTLDHIMLPCLLKKKRLHPCIDQPTLISLFPLTSVSHVLTPYRTKATRQAALP